MNSEKAVGASEPIRGVLIDVLGKDGFGTVTDTVDFTVEHPDNNEHGDYASNIALMIGRKTGRNPREVAEDFQKQLAGKIADVGRIEVAGPGFLNFYFSRDFFSGRVMQICADGDTWGKGNSEKGQEVLLEYTSPNLFKPLHVGNLVGNIIGESIARLFEMHGATIRRINYPSDIGLTVAKGIWGLQKTDGNASSIEALGEAYRIGNEAYENDSRAKQEIESINQKLYAGGDTFQNVLAQGKQASLSHLDDLCRQLGTIFDTVIFESEVGDTGSTLVREHIADSVFEEDDGAVIFRGEKHGLHTRVFINSQGLPTYEAKDLGNFIRKQEQYPDWDRSIVVTGSEQREYFQVLLAAIREIFPLPPEKTLEHIVNGFLTLSTGKMSSRRGNVLTGESLLADLQKEALVRAKETRADDVQILSGQIAVAALKYQILRRTVGSDMVFDKERAFSFEGDSGPYLQYTYARCMSVLQKAEAAGIVASLNMPEVPDTVYPVERYVYQFSEVIAVALKKRSPHHLVAYLTELAGMFNSFYAKERIADSGDAFAPYKAMITRAVAHTLKNGLWALGIEAPEKM